MKSQSPYRTNLLRGGVRNLKEFGYPSVTEQNILADRVFGRFFEGMLRENLGMNHRIDEAINELLAEIAALRMSATESERTTAPAQNAGTVEPKQGFKE